MARQHNGSSSSERSYYPQLHKATSEFLPQCGLPLLSDDGRMRWTRRMLAMLAILMAWNGSATLLDRFHDARRTLVKIYSTRRRPGKCHEGFARALAKYGAGILGALCDHWRLCVRDVAAGYWEVCDWVVIGVDGTRINCPRTQANEKGFGVSGKNNGGPQQLLVCLFHVGSGILWGWIHGAIKGGSERGLLRQMLGLLPGNALLLADAGFCGYDLLSLILKRGNHFLIRVGGNVTLLKKLGVAQFERKGTVYLWPLEQQGMCHRGRKGKPPKSLTGVAAPLVLRLIELKDAKGRPVCLLTSVLEKSRLSDRSAALLYKMRWGVEVMWRGLKQTMGHHKMLSGTPQRAKAELDWAMAGLWMMQLMSVKQMIASGRMPKQYSLANSLRVLRRAMNGHGKPSGGNGKSKGLKADLRDAVMDGYRRKGSKAARSYPKKRPQTPPDRPLARMASSEERQLAQRVLEHSPPKSAAA